MQRSCISRASYLSSLQAWPWLIIHSQTCHCLYRYLPTYHAATCKLAVPASDIIASLGTGGQLFWSDCLRGRDAGVHLARPEYFLCEGSLRLGSRHCLLCTRAPHRNLCALPPLAHSSKQISSVVARAAEVFPLSAAINYFRPTKRIEFPSQVMLWYAGTKAPPAR